MSKIQIDGCMTRLEINKSNPKGLSKYFAQFGIVVLLY